MNYFRKILAALSLCLFSINIINAQITNGGFETTTTQPGFCVLNPDFIPSPWLKRNSCDHRIQGINISSACSAHSGWATGGFAASAANNTPSIPYREYILQQISLNGGTKYKVEFWVKRTAGNTNIKIGGLVNTTNYQNVTTQNSECGYGQHPACSWLNVANPTVSAMIAGNNNQWTKIIGFYTPPSTGTYYITIGNFALTGVEGTQLNYFNLDDVSVTPCTGTGNPNPQLSLNANAFCDGQTVTADGSTSTNVDCYRWELWDQGGTTFLTASLWQTGTPSSNYNVNNLYNLQKGNCYRLKLVTIEQCDQQEAFEDFCIEDPLVSLSLTGTNPYCEGDNITITATGDNGWTYSWSTGQTGTGLKNINVTTNTNTTQYSVTVTTSAGCTATQIIPVTVHSNNNTAPTTDGINNTGDFTYYVNAAKFPWQNNSFSFNVNSFDVPNEDVDMISINTSQLPSGTTFNINQIPAKNFGVFNWPSPGPTINDIGTYSFTIEVIDNNACNPLSRQYTYNINVLCENCPLDVYYQDRHPNNKPLPSVTEAGRKIVAGYNVDANQPLGSVETGSASVLFEAPQVIEMLPGFTAGPNYTAQINPTACTNDCDVCCDNFSGFTYDPIPNVFTPNGDLINDIWYVSDFANPNCAFNAKHFKLEIFSPFLAGGVKVWEKNDINVYDRCCFFQSPSASCLPNCPNPYPKSDVYWDGTSNQNGIPLFPSGSPLPQGTYFYALEMWGCGNTVTEAGFITLCYNCNLRTTNDSNINIGTSELIMIDQEDFSGLTEIENNEDLMGNNQLIIYPNPTKDKLYVKLNTQSFINGNIGIYSVQGKLLHMQAVNESASFVDVTNLANGTYFIRLNTTNKIYNQMFIKE